MYKVLDLREGTCLQREDIFGNTSDATYESRHDAESAIINVCYISGLNSLYSEPDHQKLLPCYFEIVNS